MLAAPGDKVVVSDLDVAAPAAATEGETHVVGREAADFTSVVVEVQLPPASYKTLLIVAGQ